MLYKAVSVALLGSASALVLPTAPLLNNAATTRCSALSMIDLDATRDGAAGAFDEEGGMVKGIAEGGQSFEEVMASYGEAAPTLSPENQALCVLKDPEWNVEKMDVSSTDEDFVLETSSMGYATCEIVIEPPFNTYEDYVVGFTAESSDRVSIVHDESSPIEGRTDRRGGEPLVYKVKFEPSAGTGDFVAHLCCIFPEEKMYSKFYEIKGVAK